MARKIATATTTEETELGTVTFTRSVYDDEGIDLDRLDDFYTNVAGVTFKNKDGTSRQDVIRELYCGERLYLVRDPGNKHDPEAIKVVTAKGHQVGFIRAELTDHLAPAIDRGGQFHVLVATLSGGDQDMLGVNLRVRRLQAPQRHRRRRKPVSALAVLAWIFFAVVMLGIAVVAIAWFISNTQPGLMPRTAPAPTRTMQP